MPKGTKKKAKSTGKGKNTPSATTVRPGTADPTCESVRTREPLFRTEGNEKFPILRPKTALNYKRELWELAGIASPQRVGNNVESSPMEISQDGSEWATFSPPHTVRPGLTSAKATALMQLSQTKGLHRPLSRSNPKSGQSVVNAKTPSRAKSHATPLSLRFSGGRSFSSVGTPDSSRPATTPVVSTPGFRLEGTSESISNLDVASPTRGKTVFGVYEHRDVRNGSLSRPLSILPEFRQPGTRPAPSREMLQALSKASHVHPLSRSLNTQSNRQLPRSAENVRRTIEMQEMDDDEELSRELAQVKLRKSDGDFSYTANQETINTSQAFKHSDGIDDAFDNQDDQNEKCPKNAHHKDEVQLEDDKDDIRKRPAHLSNIPLLEEMHEATRVVDENTGSFEQNAGIRRPLDNRVEVVVPIEQGDVRKYFLPKDFVDSFVSQGKQRMELLKLFVSADQIDENDPALESDRHQFVFRSFSEGAIIPSMSAATQLFDSVKTNPELITELCIKQQLGDSGVIGLIPLLHRIAHTPKSTTLGDQSAEENSLLLIKENGKLPNQSSAPVTCENRAIHIALTGLNLSARGARELMVGALDDAAVVEDLDVSGNAFGSQGMRFISPVMKRKSIRRLVVSNCSIGDDGLNMSAPFSTPLVSPSTNTLRGQQAGHPIGAGRNDIRKIQSVSERLRALESNALQAARQMQISTHGAATPVSSPKLYIRYFDISRNHIGTQGGKLLAEIVTNSPYLLQLNASWNKIRLDGAQRLCEAIAQHASLQFVDLSWNGLGRDGIVAMSDGLIGNTSIQYINLSNCRLDDIGACLLAYSCRRNKSLRFVQVQGNVIGVAGGRALLRIQRFKKLKSTQARCKPDGFPFQQASFIQRPLGSQPPKLLVDRPGQVSPSGRTPTRRSRPSPGPSPLGSDQRSSFLTPKNATKGSKLRGDNNNVLPLAVMDLPIEECNGLLSEELRFGLNHCALDVPGEMQFDPSNPNGIWRLDLAVPRDKAVASELWEIAVREKSGENWKGEAIDGRGLDIPEDEDRPWIIPPKGILTVKYTSVPKPPAPENAIQSSVLNNLKGMVEKNKAVKDNHRLGLVLATAPEEYFMAAHVRDLVEKFDDRSHRVQLLASMFTRVVDLANTDAFLNTISEMERKLLASELGPLFHFHPSFPANRYTLDMSTKYDFILAKKLQEAANDENDMAKTLGLPDTGRLQRGSRCIRNATLDGAKLLFSGSMSLPTQGLMSFTYVSLAPYLPTCASKMKPFSDGEFEEFRFALSDILQSKKPDEALTVLKSRLSTGKALNCNQIISLCNMWPSPRPAFADIHKIFEQKEEEEFLDMQQAWDHERDPKLHHTLVDAFQICLGHVGNACDIWPAVRSEWSIDIRHQLADAVGWLHLWNPWFPEGEYRLDLSIPEDRIMTEMLVVLSVEEPGENWLGETFNGYGFDLPVTWAKEGGVPNKGILTLTYHAEKSWVRPKVRKELCKRVAIRLISGADVEEEETST